MPQQARSSRSRQTELGNFLIASLSFPFCVGGEGTARLARKAPFTLALHPTRFSKKPVGLDGSTFDESLMQGIFVGVMRALHRAGGNPARTARASAAHGCKT